MPAPTSSCSILSISATATACGQTSRGCAGEGGRERWKSSPLRSRVTYFKAGERRERVAGLYVVGGAYPGALEDDACGLSGERRCELSRGRTRVDRTFP